MSAFGPASAHAATHLRSVLERSAVGALALLPAAVTAAALSPHAINPAGIAAGLVLFAGASFLLGLLASQLAAGVDSAIFRQFGNRLPVVLLRHSDATLPPAAKARVHQALMSRGLPLPSATVEAAGPLHADQSYREAVAWMQARAPSSPVAGRVTRAHTLYQMRRHACAIRLVGLAVAGAMLALSVLIAVRQAETAALPAPAVTIAAVVNALMLAAWFLEARQGAVVAAAKAYALRLFTVASPADAAPVEARARRVADIDRAAFRSTSDSTP
ncbi:hypothetical protein [Mongoliimonas terrestris]|uniref:hypothetical protein n=1 Tax=Mongoliimonas terrestris TaxID=1709001 RepID=UPI000A44B60E|nr:hypothetical protein [Mongoliimonas terrestris]